jgi:Tfp pilus assembly protein PilO
MNIDKQGLKDTVLNFLIPLLALVFSGIMIFVFIWPYFREKEELLIEYDSKVALKKQLDDKLDKLNTLLDFKDVIDENSNLVANLLARDSDVPQLLTQVDTIAKEAGLTVSKLSYSMAGTGSEVEGVADIMVQFAVEGNRDQLIAFLELLEGSARLVNVDKFRFTERSEDGVLNCTSVLLSPYLFVESSAVTDDPITLDITSQEFMDLMEKVKAYKVYKSIVTIEVPKEEDLEVIEDIGETEEPIPEEGGEVPEELIEAIEATGESPEVPDLPSPEFDENI